MGKRGKTAIPLAPQHHLAEGVQWKEVRVVVLLQDCPKPVLGAVLEAMAIGALSEYADRASNMTIHDDLRQAREKWGPRFMV